MSIFVSIASYRDSQLPKTVKSLYENADSKEELIVGIISQDLNNKHKRVDWLGDQVKFVEIHAKDAKGAGYARKLAMELYDGEDYFFQIDSHTRFAKGWDTKLKRMLSEAQKDSKTEKVILSQFPAPYFVGSDGKDYFPKKDPHVWDEPSWTKPINTNKGVWGGLRQKIEDKTKPHKSLTVLAGYIFAPGRIVEDIPYDERISFMGEEICFAIRAYTRGWEIYAPNEMLLWHFYTRSEDPKVWNLKSVNKWMNIEAESNRIQKDVLLGKEKGIYGISDYDRYFEYQDLIGIDFHEFYMSGKINYKENMSVLVEEIDFLDTPVKTMYCVEGLHKECEELLCKCECHRKDK